MYKIMFFIGVCVLVPKTEGARILGVFSVPSYSHQIVYQSVIKALADRGHELVVLTPNPIGDSNLTNLHEIDLSFSYGSPKNIDFVELLQMSPLASLLTQITGLYNVAEAQLALPQVQKLIDNNQAKGFDLIILEQNSPLMYPFGAVFNCPMVGISSADLFDFSHETFGNPYHPVLYPDRFLPYMDAVTFWERLESVKFTFWLRYYKHFYMWPDVNRRIRKIFGPNVPRLEQLEKRVAMVFVNVNPIFSKPRPLVPSIVEFSSLHIRPKKPLPKDIEACLNNCTEGVIYFSLGSNMKSALLPRQLKADILQAFRELPYKILWKFEEERMPGKPDNVEIRKWLPQQDILAHASVKLFIMQGGLQSLEEAIHNRVPMLVLPCFSDQPQNTRKITRLGIGLGLDPMKLAKHDFKRTIIEIIENPRYKENINKVARLMEDQPMKSLDKVVWWMEYVIRHKGASHLTCARADISWWKYLLLDILAYYVLYTSLILILGYKTMLYVAQSLHTATSIPVCKLE